MAICARVTVLSAPVTVTEEAPTPPTPELPFRDIDDSFVHTPVIVQFAELRIILGYPDGTFRPFDDLTRGQMASIVARAFELEPVVTGPFPDVDPSGIHAGAINALAVAGIVQGRPHPPLSRLPRGTVVSDGSSHADGFGACRPSGSVRGTAGSDGSSHNQDLPGSRRRTGGVSEPAADGGNMMAMRRGR